MKGNFNNIIKGEIPIIVDFYAEWCGPCKVQAPILEEVADILKDKVRIIKIDVEKNQTLAQRYEVRGVPTIAIFKSGELLWRESGIQTSQRLINTVQQVA